MALIGDWHAHAVFSDAWLLQAVAYLETQLLLSCYIAAMYVQLAPEWYSAVAMLCTCGCCELAQQLHRP
jgi:hypothetical protein